MTAPRTPGAYLKHRRQAALLSVADVAARISTVPPTAEHRRGEWLELLEADAAPASLATIVALHAVVPFDIDVLWQLEMVRQGRIDLAPQLCGICACSECDPCFDEHGDACAWAAVDLCSACVGLVQADRAA